MITDAELKYMENSIGLFPIISKEPVWLRAFAFYNESNREPGQGGMLAVTCRPCYMKVYLFCKQHLTQ